MQNYVYNLFRASDDNKNMLTGNKNALDRTIRTRHRLRYA